MAADSFRLLEALNPVSFLFRLDLLQSECQGVIYRNEILAALNSVSFLFDGKSLTVLKGLRIYFWLSI